MRILYYNPVINEPVGAGSHGRGLAHALKRAGHTVMTIPEIVGTGGAERESAGRFVSVPELLKVPARDIRGRLRAARSSAAVVESVTAFAPELLIVRRVPNDYILPRVLKGLDCAVLAECNGIAASESRKYYRQVTLPWERSAERRFYVSADACIAITDEVSAELQSIGVRSDRIAVIHNGVDVEQFSAVGALDRDVAQWREEHGFEVVIGYCAKVSPLHDLETIALALTEIAALRPNVGFLFVGPTSDQLVDAGIPPELVQGRTLPLGLVRHESVPQLLRGADIFWAALSNSHGSPLKVFEYMALGAPVLMAAVGSGVDPIADARAGSVVGKGEYLQLRDAALLRIDDGKLRLAEGERALSWIDSRGTWDMVAEQVLTLAARVARQ